MMNDGGDDDDDGDDAFFTTIILGIEHDGLGCFNYLAKVGRLYTTVNEARSLWLTQLILIVRGGRCV